MTTNTESRELRFTYPDHLSASQRDRIAASMATHWVALVEEARRANQALGVAR